MDQRVGGGLLAQDVSRLFAMMDGMNNTELRNIATLPRHLCRDFKDTAIIFAAQSELERRGQNERV
jgi:hypothetical protein